MEKKKNAYTNITAGLYVALILVVGDLIKELFAGFGYWKYFFEALVFFFAFIYFLNKIKRN